MDRLYGLFWSKNSNKVKEVYTEWFVDKDFAEKNVRFSAPNQNEADQNQGRTRSGSFQFFVTCGNREGLNFCLMFKNDQTLVCLREIDNEHFKMIPEKFNEEINSLRTKRNENYTLGKVNSPHLSILESLNFCLDFFREEWNYGILSQIWRKKRRNVQPSKVISEAEKLGEYRKLQTESSSISDGMETESDEDEDEDGDDELEYEDEEYEDEEQDSESNEIQSLSSNKTKRRESDYFLNAIANGLKWSRISYSELDLAQMQEQMIQQCAAIYGIGHGAAGILLRQVRWNYKTFEDIMRKKKNVAEVFNKAGVFYSGAQTKTVEPFQVFGAGDRTKLEGTVNEYVECKICLDDVDITNAATMECGHVFCLPCWRQHVGSGILNGTPSGKSVLDLECPGQHEEERTMCNLVIGKEVVEALLAGEKAYEKYESALLRSFVDDNDTLSWCPNPSGCGRAVLKGNKDYEDAHCSCGYLSCLSCGSESHAPCSCEQKKIWKKGIEKYLISRDKKTNVEVSVDVLVKPCPNPSCNTPTTKISGCMYLVCVSCRCEWCWQCGNYGGGLTNRPLPHHVYACNDPRNEKWNTVVPFEDDGRFLFYYERFKNHSEAQKMADSKRTTAKLITARILESSHMMTSAEAEFVCEAYELLIVCRNVLSWTYTYAYFIQDDKYRERFQFLQGHFEKYVEEFSKEVEENNIQYLVKHRIAILNKTKALTKFLKNIVRENGSKN